MDQATKRTWAEIDLTNLEHNYRALRGMLPRGCRFLGVVKANAYGHGAIPVARKLVELGAEYLAVACLDEAVELRQAGITTPILILGPTLPEFSGELVHYDLTQAVHDFGMARELSCAAVKFGKTLKIHIKLDTGMSRLGFTCNEGEMDFSVREIVKVCSLPGIECEGIFTHFANADGDENYTMRQFTRFMDALDKLSACGVEFKIRHCAASAAVLNYPCTHLDMVRPGIAQYGHYPDPTCEGLDGPGLLPVMRVKTRVIAIRELEKGTCISYGCTYTLNRDSRIAVLPIGYADGLARLLSNRGEVLVHGMRAPILGRVCMDLCMVDVTDIPDVTVADEVIVFGPELPLEEKADTVGTIQYELLCGITRRVPRVYIG